MSQENGKALPAVGFAEATGRGLKNLFNFKGKIGRAEFWWCFLSWLISFPVVLIVFVASFGVTLGFLDSTDRIMVITGVAVIIFYLVVLLALMHRRFHDTGDNVAWANAFICLGPFAFIVSFVGMTISDLLFEMGRDALYFDTVFYCLFCLIVLILIPVCVKTVRCLLKK